MKDYTKEQIEKNRPFRDTKKVIDFCLNCLYNDNNNILSDNVVKGLTFEKLIGTLLKMRETIELLKPMESLKKDTIQTAEETNRFNKIKQDIIKKEREKNKKILENEENPDSNEA